MSKVLFNEDKDYVKPLLIQNIDSGYILIEHLHHRNLPNRGAFFVSGTHIENNNIKSNTVGLLDTSAIEAAIFILQESDFGTELNKDLNKTLKKIWLLFKNNG